MIGNKMAIAFLPDDAGVGFPERRESLPYGLEQSSVIVGIDLRLYPSNSNLVDFHETNLPVLINPIAHSVLLLAFRRRRQSFVAFVAGGANAIVGAVHAQENSIAF
jgi:hypothetical protein